MHRKKDQANGDCYNSACVPVMGLLPPKRLCKVLRGSVAPLDDPGMMRLHRSAVLGTWPPAAGPAGAVVGQVGCNTRD